MTRPMHRLVPSNYSLEALLYSSLLSAFQPRITVTTNMSSEHLYDPVNEKAEDLNTSEEEHYSYSTDRSSTVPVIHTLLSVTLILISFVAGSMLHPFQQSLQNNQGT